MNTTLRRPRTTSAFTLVELLVVIGIIALLISILLPALGSARRQANTVKCAASLREIGNYFRMYGIENRGLYPPGQLAPGTGQSYVIQGVSYPSPPPTLIPAYWFNFLTKYGTKAKLGSASTT